MITISTGSSKAKSRIMTMKLAVFSVIIALTNFGICAFQLSMVASRAPFGSRYDPSVVTPKKNPYVGSIQSASTAASPSITSTLISQLACMALKRRLKDQTHVSCDLTANSNGLLQGLVGPVTVKGRGWRSSLGLTCKAIEATIDKCQLDMGKVLANQKLVLTTPAKGRAMVALSAEDFGNFITHPLMRAPVPPKIAGFDNSGTKLQFSRENVSIEPKQGLVTFFGTCAGATWKFILQRSPSAKKALIEVSLVELNENVRYDVDVSSVAEALAVSTSKFFNEMVFELDGTFLSFNDMMLTEKGAEPSIMFALTILVRKFPSPGLEF